MPDGKRYMNDDDFAELLGAVEQMRSIERNEVTPEESGARVTRLPVPDAASIREAMGRSQSSFAALLGVSVRTLQNWEQKHHTPSGPAVQLLRVAAKHPDAVLDAVAV